MKNFVKSLFLMLLGGVLVGGVLMATGAYAQLSPSESDTPDQPVVADATLSYPAVFGYQGQLLSPSTGKPVANGVYPMTFRLYTDGSTPNSFWGQPLSVQVTDGLFNVTLGAADGFAIPVEAFDGRDLFLGIQVSGDAEMTPRQPIRPVPYAMNSRFFNGKTTSDFVETKRGPVAYGIVKSDGGREKGYRFSSGRANTGTYEITVKDANDDNINYNLNDYVTVVTVVGSDLCTGGSYATSGSGGGKLFIDVFNSAGQRRDCKFHFMTFKP
ncbi:MAG: hypothetical protein KDD78_17795 [Caldilineaceae bacterium]|nr:hypothetical protein [Caldilineaceae bacterium]